MANKKRLIPASKLEIVLAKKFRNGMIHYDDLMATIADISTVDAVEVVHGRWEFEREYEDGTADYKCSACDYDDAFHRNLVYVFYNYCPNCGAKMDGGNEDG